MSIAQLVSDRAQSIHDALARSQDLLEERFRVLAGCEIKLFNNQSMQSGQIRRLVVRDSAAIKDVLTYRFQQSACSRDSPFGIIKATL